MRLVIAMMKHETNTFSPVKTDWRRFLDWGAYSGRRRGAPMRARRCRSAPISSSRARSAPRW